MQGKTPRPAAQVRVLIAEDDPISGAVCARALKNAGYGAVVVASGEEALRLLQAELFDLVVADVMMPGMDGFALVRAMRADERLTRLPVVFLTGCREQTMRMRGYRAGGDGYLTKPVRPAELVDQVESLLMSAMGTSAQLNGAYLSGRLDGTSVVSILAFLHVQERSGMLRPHASAPAARLRSWRASRARRLWAPISREKQRSRPCSAGTPVRSASSASTRAS
jgi:CheY-like chemotaxis protein